MNNNLYKKAYAFAIQVVKYWLALLKDTDFIDQKSFQSMYDDADELAKILYTILSKTRKKD